MNGALPVPGESRLGETAQRRVTGPSYRGVSRQKRAKRPPAQRRAAEAARRTAASKRIGPRPLTSRTLFALRPPGEYYERDECWARLSTDIEQQAALDAVAGDPGALEALRALHRFSHVYGREIPAAAALHLDSMLRSSGYLTDFSQLSGISEDDALESLHGLHASGLLLVADDGSVWLTVPPGTPVSAPGDEWAFVEQKIGAPEKLLESARNLPSEHSY